MNHRNNIKWYDMYVELSTQHDISLSKRKTYSLCQIEKHILSFFLCTTV